MKNMIFLFIGLLLLYGGEQSFGSDSSSDKKVSESNSTMEHLIRIQSSPDLYSITKTWAKEYSKLNPEVGIEVVLLTGTPEASDLKAGKCLSFVSTEYMKVLEDNDLWKMVVGTDLIVPVINSKNPFLKNIKKQGISSDELALLFKHPEKQTWGTILGDNQAAPVHFYQTNDVIIQSQAAQFLNSDPTLINGINTGGMEAMVLAIQNDPYGIGFCRMEDVVNPENQSLVKNIMLMPIDKNRNGTLDSFENIYGNLNDFARGLWIGKYPRTLSRPIYSVSSVKPASQAEVAFLKWVLVEGQEFLIPDSYAELSNSERHAKKIAMLTSNPTQIGMLTNTGFFANKLHDLSLFSLIVIILIPFVLAYMIGDAVIRHKRQKKAVVMDTKSLAPAVFDENTVAVPNGLYFDKSHMWAFMEKNGVVRIGIDDFLQHVTGPLNRVKMKSPGEKVKKGDQLLSIIQNGKQLTIHAPISGTIKAQNKLLNTDASMMNSAPYSDGWVYMIEPTNWVREIRFLFMGEKSKEWLRKEFSRLKDFLAVSMKGDQVDYAHVIMQDGGVVKEGVLADLGPEVWEDFQTTFINTSQ
ncbi:MAG: hypothetical protein ABIJ04_03220 [Bacteroidota bacterium]